MREIFSILLISLVLISCNGGDGSNGKAEASNSSAKINAYDANGQYLGIFLGNEDVSNVVDNDLNSNDNQQQQLQIGGSPQANITTYAASPEPVAEIFIPALGYVIRISQHTGDIVDRDLRFESLDCTGPRYSASANRIYRDYDESYFVGIEGPVEIEYPEQPDCAENWIGNQTYPIASRLSLVDDELECTLVEDYMECPLPEQGQFQIGGSPSAYAHINPWYLTEEISISLVLPVALPLRYIYE